MSPEEIRQFLNKNCESFIFAMMDPDDHALVLCKGKDIVGLNLVLSAHILEFLGISLDPMIFKLQKAEKDKTDAH
jgi:hypothetical protein